MKQLHIFIKGKKYAEQHTLELVGLLNLNNQQQTLELAGPLNSSVKFVYFNDLLVNCQIKELVSLILPLNSSCNHKKLALKINEKNLCNPND